MIDRSSKNILPTYDFWTQNSVAFCCSNIGVVVGHWAAMAETIWAYILGSCILFDNSKRRQMNSTQNLVVYKVAKTYQKRFSQAEANLGKWNVFYSAPGIVMGPSLGPTQARPVHFLGLLLEILSLIYWCRRKCPNKKQFQSGFGQTSMMRRSIAFGTLRIRS